MSLVNYGGAACLLTAGDTRVVIEAAVLNNQTIQCVTAPFEGAAVVVAIVAELLLLLLLW